MARKPRPLDRTVPSSRRDTSLIIIASEDTYGPKQYFERFWNRRVQVKVLETTDGKSAPNHVLERLNKFCDEYDLGEGDQLWLLLDLDNWKTKSLSEVLTASNQKGYNVCVNNPCFDLWILLHYYTPQSSDVFTCCDDVGEKLRSLIGGFNKCNISNLNLNESSILQAVQNAKLLDNGDAGWAQSTGAPVFKLVEELIKGGFGN